MNHPSSRIAEWRAGWSVVLSSAIGIGTGAALYQYVSSLFIAPLESELGWSRGDVALIGATPLIGALSAPLIGRIADRYGIRPVAIVATIAIAIAFAGLSTIDASIWQALLWMILLGLAAPGTVGLVYSRGISGWFTASRGLALGLMSSGISIAALIATPLVARAIEAEGSSGGYLALAAIAMFVGLPAVLIGVRERPDTDPGISDEPVLAAGDTPPLAPLLRTRRFWLLVAIMFLMNIPSSGILTQLAPLLTGKGLSTGTAAFLMATYAVSVLVGRIGIGWLFDRLPAARVAAIVTLISAFGCLSFLSATPMAFVAFGVVTVGLMQGAETDVLAYFVARLFDHRHFSSIYGLQVTGGMLGTAVGVIGFGQLYDIFGGYDAVLTIGAAMLMLVAALYLLCDKPMRAAAIATI